MASRTGEESRAFLQCSVCEQQKTGYKPEHPTLSNAVCVSCLEKQRRYTMLQHTMNDQAIHAGTDGLTNIQKRDHVNSLSRQNRKDLVSPLQTAQIEKDPHSKWCTNCKMTINGKCKPGHAVIQLKSESARLYLRLLLETCETRWKSALEGERKIQQHLIAVSHSFVYLSNQAALAVQANQRKMEALQAALQTVEEDAHINHISDNAIEMFEKYSSKCQEAEKDMKMTCDISETLEKITQIKLSFRVKNESVTNGCQEMSLELPEQPKDAIEVIFRAALSYVILEALTKHQFQPSSAPAHHSSVPLAPIPTIVKEKSEALLTKNEVERNGVKPKSVTGTGKTPTLKDRPGIEILKPIGSPNIPEKCFLKLVIEGQYSGKIVIQLKWDAAPKMCEKFAQYCISEGGAGYRGGRIFKVTPNKLVTGSTRGKGDDLYIGDRSPLKRCRGSIFMRLKKDYTVKQCFIVGAEFAIHLNDIEDVHDDSTIFGFVESGLSVCDSISRMDCRKNRVIISDAGHL